MNEGTILILIYAIVLLGMIPLEIMRRKRLRKGLVDRLL